MSDGSLNKIEKLGEIAQRHGQKGLQKLMVFKLLKMRASQSLREEYGSLPINQDFNRLCMEVADKIVEEGRESPSEEDLRSLMLSIRESGVTLRR